MNPSIPASFHLGAASAPSSTSMTSSSASDADTQNYRLALLQAILEKEQRSDDMSGGFPTARQHLASLRGQQQSLRQSATAREGLQAFMNSDELVNSLLGGAAASSAAAAPAPSAADAQAGVDPLRRLLALQQLQQQQEAAAAAAAPGVAPSLENKLQLQRILAETASQEQQRRSLEDLVRLNRIEQLRLQEAVLGASKADAGGSSSTTTTALPLRQRSPRSQQRLLSQQQDGGLMLLPGLLRDKVQAPLAGMSAVVGGASQFLPLLDRPRKDNIATASSLLLGSNLKRKAESNSLLDDLAMKKRPAVSSRSKMVASTTFPLPRAKEEEEEEEETKTSDEMVGSSKLSSYERQWNKLQSLGAQKEIFLDRIRRNKVTLVGETRSAILEEKRALALQQQPNSSNSSVSSSASAAKIGNKYAML